MDIYTFDLYLVGYTIVVKMDIEPYSVIQFCIGTVILDVKVFNSYVFAVSDLYGML